MTIRLFRTVPIVDGWSQSTQYVGVRPLAWNDMQDPEIGFVEVEQSESELERVTRQRDELLTALKTVYKKILSGSSFFGVDEVTWLRDIVADVEFDL